jgi:hypothetical protein
MKHKHYAFYFVLGLILVDAAPPHNALMPACLGQGCDLDSGPVCGIDDTGMPRTFENRCMADLAYCQYGTYFAEVKPGECW